MPHRRQRHKIDAIRQRSRSIRHQRLGHIQRQPRLANPARPNQRQQPALVLRQKQLADGLGFFLSPQEARSLRGQVVAGGGWRGDKVIG